MEDEDLINKLVQEIQIRKYSPQTERSYVRIVKKFLDSKKEPKNFLLLFSNKSRSTMRNTFFALKFFYEEVLRKSFDDEKIPIAKNTLKIPVVLNKNEINQMIKSIENIKHRLIVMFLYYTGLRLDELRNL